MIELKNVLRRSEKNRILASAIKLVENIGMLCSSTELLRYYRQAGCELGEELKKPKGAKMVKFTEKILMDALEKAPSRYSLYPTSPGYKEIKYMSGETYFGNGGGDYTWDLETEQLRPGCGGIQAC